MADTHVPNLFVNLAVQDLERSKAFFTKLGFEFDPRFTDDKAACLVIGGGSYAMLLTEPFFRSFTPRAPCDTATHTEGMFAMSCGSRREVDALVDKALAEGGRPVKEAEDHGFMYGRAFYDPDGHHWEAFWMDPSALSG